MAVAYSVPSHYLNQWDALLTWTLRNKTLWNVNRNSLFTWWRHQLETFSALLAICAGNSPVPCRRPPCEPWNTGGKHPLGYMLKPSAAVYYFTVIWCQDQWVLIPDIDLYVLWRVLYYRKPSRLAPSGMVLGWRPANERRRYKVTPSLIGWAAK